MNPWFKVVLHAPIVTMSETIVKHVSQTLEVDQPDRTETEE